MFAADLLTNEELEAIDREMRTIVDASVEFAEAAPEPEVDSLYRSVYSEINPHGRLFFDGRGK
jgi:TPP-dependent pyruvate/acetoin dehydrogenase alpha subunit